jgi:MoaA/NifB/PqqE/SkfB family radical SAM enzyme
MKKKYSKKYYTYWSFVKRHLGTSLPFLNFRKIVNIIRVKVEEKLGKTIVKGKPFFIKIEPTNRCNLRCKGCMHAVDRQEIEKSGFLGNMDFKVFKKIIDPLQKYLIRVSLYYMGESLVHPEISKMVKYLSDRKIGSVISSNLNYLPEKLAHELVKNKLTYLIVSVDGIKPKTYESIRCGGDINKVIENIKLIQAEKKKQKSKYPIIEVQTINFKDIKEDEIKEIKKIAKDLGVEKFFLKEDGLRYHREKTPEKKRCYWLYAHPSFRWDGTLEPCCFFYENESLFFGNIEKEKFDDIWNNQKYQEARKYFKTGEKGRDDLKCYDCIYFTNSNN